MRRATIHGKSDEEDREMANGIWTWLTTHPLSAWLLSIVSSGLIAAWVTLAWPSIKKFFTLPPQRLSTWILKARIAGAESKMEWANSTKELRYLVYFCFKTLFHWAFSLTLFSLSFTEMVLLKLDAPKHIAHSFQGAPELIFGTLNMVGAILFFVVAMRGWLQITRAVSAPDKLIGEISAQIERLKEKLRLKTAERSRG
jgi:hypothetical protein